MGQPKALLQYKGQTFLDRLIGLFEGCCSEVIVVVRKELDLSSLVGRAKLVTNPDPERGMLSSLQCGLSAISSEAEGVLFCPVDFAPIDASTVHSVVDGFNGTMALPIHKGKRGHPCLISLSIVQQLLRQPVDASAKPIIHAHLALANLIAVKDRWAVKDIDEPTDYQELLQEEEMNVEG